MTGPITAFFTALVGSAVLSRPKLPESEPDPKERQIGELTAELALLRPAYNSLLHMFAEEQAQRLRVERDLIEAEARLECLRSNAKRSQAPEHLPPSWRPVLSSEQAQRLGAQAQMAQIRVLREPPLMPGTLEQAMRSMDAFICNCAPGRHEAMFGTIEIAGDD
jgi:hypothetical protein